MGSAAFAALLALAISAGAAHGDRKVLIWWANPNNPATLSATLSDMRAHHAAFTGIAYQGYAVCGAGSDDVGGSNDCAKLDAVGTMPHFAHGHPVGVPADLGAQLRGAVGADLELWPVISYGNPGNASVLNRLLADEAGTAAFAAAAIAEAHARRLTGYNLDLETAGVVGMGVFLQRFAAALAAARPPVGVSYDGGNDPASAPAGTTAMSRWVSMATYTASQAAFDAGVAEGVKSCGAAAFGVGLCPACQYLGDDAVQARFDTVERLGKGAIEELDLWCWVSNSSSWDPYWPRLEAWLNGSSSGSSSGSARAE